MATVTVHADLGGGHHQPAPAPAPHHQPPPAHHEPAPAHHSPPPAHHDKPASAPASSGASPPPSGATPSSAAASAAITSNEHAAKASGMLSPGFETSLFGCFENPVGCAIICCVPCLTLAANEANVQKRPVTLCDCLAFCPSAYQTRQNLRSQHNMGYAPLQDCLTAWCCPCCFISQNTREIAKKQGKAPEYMKML